MAATSYPIAHAALDALARLAEPVGQPITSVVETTTDAIYSPIGVFGVDENGDLFRGMLVDSPEDLTKNGASAHDTFDGFKPFDGPVFAAASSGPGFTVKSLASAVTWDGRVQVFALDRAGNVFSRWQESPRDDTHWSPWIHLDGILNSIAVARNHDGRLQIFGTTPDGRILSRYQLLNTQTEAAGQFVPTSSGSIHPAVDAWTAWQAVDGMASQVSALTVKDSAGFMSIRLFAINGNGQLFERHQSADNNVSFLVAGNWTPWAQQSTPNNGKLLSIGAFEDHGLRVNVMGTLSGGLLFQQLWGVTGWAQVPGQNFGGFAAVKEGGGAGSDELLGVDVNGNVQLNYSYGVLRTGPSGTRLPDTWNAWEPAGGARLRSFPGGPAGTPVLANLTKADGATTVTAIDESSNENGFRVHRITAMGTPASDVANYRAVDSVGTGDILTVVDAAPDPAAPCYRVDAYDDKLTFSSPSPIICQAPTVLDMTQAEAVSAITAAGLEVGSVSFVNNCVSTGTVRSQSISGGVPATLGLTVDVVISSCSTTVPNIVGLQTNGGSTSSAAAALQTAHLTFGTITSAHSHAAAGTVISQDPTSAQSVSQGTAVNVTVSDGKAIVPDIIGDTQSTATGKIVSAGLLLGTVATIHSAVALGTVLDQSPGGSSLVNAGTKVNLTVSDGKVVVPNIVGLTVAQASSALGAAGLVLGNESTLATNDCTITGTVAAQATPAGSLLTVGSSVGYTRYVVAGSCQ
jgi:beta-lactam-binding protein with PASTA domain